MSNNDMEKILEGAAANVACESGEEVSKETLESIKKQLLGLSNSSDDSFIYTLYKSIIEKREVDEDGKNNHKK